MSDEREARPEVTATATAAVAPSDTATGFDSAATTGPWAQREPMPQRAGRWRVLGRLGEGGMGEVFRAVDDDGHIVALKRARAARATHIRALRREADALEALAQPGIARLIDRGEQDGRPWYAMAFVDGPTLDRYVLGRPLRERLVLLVELCAILDRLHRAGGVHRDVKPANVLVEDGAPVLVDFGLLVRIGGGRGQPGWARDTVHGAPDASGTVGYRAPELRRGQWCDGRADLYAVGRMLADWIAETGAGTPELLALSGALLADDPADRPRDGGAAARRLARLAGLEAPVFEADGTPLHRVASVGRDAEIAALDAALDRAAHGRGGVVVLDGPSGIGKTRLALEAVRRAGGFRTVVDECRAVGGGLLQGLEAVIHRAVDQGRGDAARTLALFGDHGPYLSPFVPAVGELRGQIAGLPTVAPPRVATAVAHVVGALAIDRPLLLVIDDVQWAGRLSALALRQLVQAPGPALIVLTARSDVPSPDLETLRSHPGVLWLSLGPLERADAHALVGRLLGAPEPDPALVAEIGERAGGNPFFVAECLRAMIAEGRLTADDDGWRYDSARSAPALPAAAEAAIRSRLERLSVTGRALVEALAVLGLKASPDRLAAVLGRAPETDAVDELVRRAVWHRGEGGFGFAHDRLRHVALQGVPADRQRMLHRRAAADLEARPGVDAYANARSLAFHHDGAEQVEAAGRALREAGRLAEARGAIDDAAICFAGAATRLSGIGGIGARVDEGRCLAAGGRYREAVESHSAAAEAARAVDARALEAAACSALGLTLVHVDRVEAAEVALRRAIELFDALGDAIELATACTRLGTVCVHRGAFDEADALQQRALSLQTDEADAVGMARTLNNMAVVAGTRGRHDLALVQVTRALDAARRAGRPSMALGIRMHRAQVLHRAGELGPARTELDGCIIELAEVGMLPQLGWALVGRATLRRQRGPDPAPGWADLERAGAIFAEIDYATLHAVLAIERGHHLLAEGRSAESAVDVARAQAARAGVEPETPSIMGRALAGLIEAQARFEAGERLFRGQIRERIFPAVQAWLDAHGDGLGADGVQRPR